MPQPTGASAPSPTPAAVPRWQVAKAVGPVVAYTAPSTSAAVRQRFSAVNVNGFPSIFLVRSVRQVGAATWYDVWLPIRPNESHGWIREGGVAIYSTVAKIVINLAKRRLSVYRRGVLMGTFRVAVGVPALPTPTGIYYINQKLRPTTSGGPYGVLALGISAYHIARKQNVDFFKHSFNLAAIVGTIAIVLVILGGHEQGLWLLNNQPMKAASAEALWDTEDPASFSLLTIGDLTGKHEVWQIRIPDVLSLLYYNQLSGKVTGIIPEFLVDMEATRHSLGQLDERQGLPGELESRPGKLHREPSFQSPGLKGRDGHAELR